MADTRYDGPSVEVASYGSVPKIRWAAVGCSTVMIKMAGALGCHRSWFFYSKFLKVQYNSCFVFPQHHKLSPATLLHLTLGQKSIFCPKNSIWVNIEKSWQNLNFRVKKTPIKELADLSNFWSNWNILWTKKNWFLPKCGHVLFFFEAGIGHIGIPATYILEGLLLLFPQLLSILQHTGTVNNEARTTSLKPTVSLPKETYKRTFYTKSQTTVQIRVLSLDYNCSLFS